MTALRCSDERGSVHGLQASYQAQRFVESGGSMIIRGRSVQRLPHAPFAWRALGGVAILEEVGRAIQDMQQFLSGHPLIAALFLGVLVGLAIGAGIVLGARGPGWKSHSKNVSHRQTRNRTSRKEIPAKLARRSPPTKRGTEDGARTGR